MRTKSAAKNRINVITLGCSKNVYDSEVLMGQLKAAGKDVVHEEEGRIVVINTCGFIENAKEESINTILEAVEAVNDAQKSVMVTKIKAHFGSDLRGKHFAFWGLSFKPQTDDMREAPSVVIAESLMALGATVTAYDPVAIEEAKHQLQDRITYAADAYQALTGADALLLITEWSEFRVPNWSRVKDALRQPVVFDGRNIYSGTELRALGFTYSGIGVL